tara:strand:- start:78 stop:755 length:678 start_codon:yes stop_codon:yes gene_type:complete
MILTQGEREITAYHEGGHALVAYHTKDADPVHKVTIIPRGRALGVTAQLPVDEKHNYSKNYLLGRLNILMGGRCAEKLIFNDTTTGAGNDISVATDLSRKMVSEWGMTDKIGPLAFAQKAEEIFLGRDISQGNDLSNEMCNLIDSEITKLVKAAEENAENILKKHIDQLHAVAKALLEFETIDGNDLTRLVKGEKIVKIQPDKLSDEKPRRRRSKKDKTLENPSA